LNLFVLWIDVADHPHFSVPPYDLAFLANFLDRWSNFHFLKHLFNPEPLGELPGFLVILRQAQDDNWVRMTLGDVTWFLGHPSTGSG
jgi:hypothetical protein